MAELEPGILGLQYEFCLATTKTYLHSYAWITLQTSYYWENI